MALAGMGRVCILRVMTPFQSFDARTEGNGHCYTGIVNLHGGVRSLIDFVLTHLLMFSSPHPLS